MLSKHGDIKISEIIDVLRKFPKDYNFFNLGTKYFYKEEGGTLLRYSECLNKWILELDKKQLDTDANLDYQRVCEIIMVAHIQSDYSISKHFEIMP